MKILGIIPARYASTRFPGKPPAGLARLVMWGALAACIGLATGCRAPKRQVLTSEETRIEMSAASAKSPFNNYDREVVRGIQTRWYELIEENGRKLKPDIRGTVVVEFHLMQDGRVKNFHVVKSTVGEPHTLLCQKAILDPAPFRRWPDEMARMVNSPYREIRFTFYYE